MSNSVQVRDVSAGYSCDAPLHPEIADYKHSEVGPIPSSWQMVSIREVAEVKGGKRLPAGFSLTDHETPHPYIRVADLIPGGINTSHIKYVPVSAFPAIRNYCIYREDIFISVAGSLGIVGVVPNELSGASLTENADRLTDIRCDRDYLMYWLMSRTIQSSIDAIRTVGAQPKLALSRIARFEIALPPTRKEQRAIAAALSDVDGLLGALEELIAKKRAIKQAAMQQLLTGKTRLPGFSGQWGEAPLPQATTIRKGSLITSHTIKPGQVPVIAGGMTPAYYHTDANRFQPCVTVSASGASAGYVAFHKKPIFASDCSTVEGTATVTVEFAYYWLLNNQSVIYGLQTGGAQPHVQPKDLARLSISYPLLEEQKAIITVLSDMDAEIAALEARRNKTHAIKQGMMQQLLTGQVRLVKQGVAS